MEAEKVNGLLGRYVYSISNLIRNHTNVTQAAKLAKEYEKKGGDYENEPGSKNQPEKGTPKPKSSAKKETKVRSIGKKKAFVEGGSGGRRESRF